MRILSLHAHPDDAEILAGGTLALLTARGHSITIATMTPGDCGTAEYSREEISEIRRQEAARSAALIGAEYHCLGFGDLNIFEDDTSRRRVTAALRRFRPDLILTAAVSDYMPDHETTGRLVRDACFAASAPNYGTASIDAAPPLPGIPHLYFMDPVEGKDRDGHFVRPGFMVDVTGVFETRRRMLAMHESQRNWLRKQHAMDDYIETMERWCRAQGARAGFTFGEGFRQYLGHAYPRTPLLEDILGPAAIYRL